MINADDGNPVAFVEKAFQWVAPEIVKRARPKTAAAPPPGWERYAGRYRSAWVDIQVLLVDGGLAMIDPSQPDPTLAVTRLHPAGEHVFRMQTVDGFGGNGELVAFELDAHDRVTRARVGVNEMHPVTEW